MLMKEIKTRISGIKALIESTRDFEAAHGLEDDLYHDFVKHIALTGTKAQRSMATAVLQTKHVIFTRHCS